MRRIGQLEQSRTGRLLLRTSALALAVAIGAAGMWSLSEPPVSPANAAPYGSAPAVSQQALPASFADLVERVSPAVVSIRVEQEAPKAVSELPPQFNFPPGSPLERFFRDFGMQPAPGQPRHRGMAEGSGFLISKDGYIVTNNHVVEDAAKVSVQFADGKPIEAKIVGRDPKTDLAVLKIDETVPVAPISFAAEDRLRVGDWVLTIGNPFGLGGTVTTGIVSARGRDIGAGPYDDFIQIDAPINPGNSGGPAFDISGSVVGVNTAIFSPSGGNVGIGFAIPASIARDVVADLIDKGQVARGWLGVAIQPVDEQIAEGLGIETAQGAIVAEIVPKSPAEKAGILQGDVITAIDGETMADARAVSRYIAGITPDQTATFTLLRDGKEKTVSVKVGEAPAERVAMREDADTSALGLSLARADQGVEVAAVMPGSAADEQGIRPGDIILRAGEQVVDDPKGVEEAVAAAEKSGNDAVLLLIKSQQGQRFVALPLSSA